MSPILNGIGYAMGDEEISSSPRHSSRALAIIKAEAPFCWAFSPTANAITTIKHQGARGKENDNENETKPG